MRSRRFYQENKTEHGQVTLACRLKRTAHNQVRILEYLAGQVCVDCGFGGHPAAMEFDHVRGRKSQNVSSMVKSGYAWATILTEIAKCEVRCSNCHRRRTAQVLGWFSASPPGC